MKVTITSSAGRGHRRFEWAIDVDDDADFAFALGLFLQDNYGWGK